MDRKKLEFKGEQALRELEQLTLKAKEIQECILMEILTRNSRTEYLSKYMGGSTDISEYQRRVPVIKYDAVQPYIQRIANGGDSSILSGRPITEMLISSGTSGGEPRLMPSIAEDLDRRTYLYNLIMPIMNQYVPGLDKGKALYLLFVKPEMPTPCGIPARPVLTSYYKSYHFRHRAADPFNNYTSPDSAILCADALQSMYCQLLAGLVHRHSVLRIGAVFASALLRSITFLERYWHNMCHDIRTGQVDSSITDLKLRVAMLEMLQPPDKSLAKEVDEICRSKSWKGVLCRLWPNAKYIEAVLTGSMAQYIPALEFYTAKKIPLVCVMYASSESYLGVNMKPLCDLADVSYTLLPNMAYFEFMELKNYGGHAKNEERDDGEKLVALVDVKVGCFYEIVVTTFAGLYRYRIGDVLQVTGFHNSAPMFRFICRRNVVLSIENDKTSEEDLHKSIAATCKKYLEPEGLLLSEYTSHADTSTVPGHYVLFWELTSINDGLKDVHALLDREKLLQNCCVDIEDSLDYVYRRCRADDGSVGPLEIRAVATGTFEALMDFFIGRGSSINQYKTPRCIESGSAALELLNSKVMIRVFSDIVPQWNP